MAKKKLKINWNDLEGAFEEGSYEFAYYLNLETGSIILVQDDVQIYVDQLEGELDSDDVIRAEVDQLDIPDWQKQAVFDAISVELSHDKFLQIPEQNSRVGYEDMEQFIWSIEDDNPDLAATLERDINGRGAFRRFRLTIDSDPDIREQWFAFKDKHWRERMMKWLEDKGIEAEFI